MCSWKRWEARNQVSKHFQNSTKKILARTNKSSLVWKFWKTLFKLKCYPTSRAGRGPSSQSLMCSTLEAGILNTPDHFFVQEQSHKNSDGNFFANFWMFSQPPHLLAEWWQSQGEQGTCLWPGLSLNSPMDVYFNTRSVLLRRSSSVSFSSSIPMDISFHARWLPFGKNNWQNWWNMEKKMIKKQLFSGILAAPEARQGIIDKRRAGLRKLSKKQRNCPAGGGWHNLPSNSWSPNRPHVTVSDILALKISIVNLQRVKCW